MHYRARFFTGDMRGFTLLEMIVSLGIFAVVALVSTSILLSLADAQNKAFSIQDAYDNMRFALEVMSKDIRTGDIYHCGIEPPALSQPNDCGAGADNFTYKSAAGELITYRLSDGRIEKIVGGVLSGSLTAEAVKIENLTFYVLGTVLADQIHPRVTIVIKGSAGRGRSASIFNIQTTVGQRKVNP